MAAARTVYYACKSCQFISEQTGVPCYVAEDPASCVAIGAGRVLEDLRTYKDVIYDYRRGDYSAA